METIRQTQKKYGSRALTAAILAGFFLVLIGQAPVGKGLILGTVFSIVNFVLMGQTLSLKLNPSKGKSVLFSFFSLSFRYVVIAVPLIVAIKYDQYNFYATAFGIFMVQLFILAEQVFNNYFVKP